MSGYFGIPLRNGLPLGLGTVACLGVNATASWSPLSLFAAGEQGGWYDPTDLTTMFQDSAGTTPVTAVEQPVGRWLDKSGRGNHLIQPTSASRPTYSKRYNVLLATEDFSAAAWTKTRANVIAAMTVQAATTDVSGTWVGQQITGAVGSNTLMCRVAKSQGWVMLTGGNNSVQANNVRVWLNTDTGALGAAQNNGSGFAVVGTPSVDDVGAHWQFSITYTADTANQFQRAYVVDSNALLAVTAGRTVQFVPGVDFRRTIHTTMGMPAYQRVTTATDYDETGFLPRLRFDGADDSMYSAASVNFSATDEMTVLAGLTTLGGNGMVLETSIDAAANNGAIVLYDNNSNTRFDWWSRGNVLAQTSASRTAPVTRVLTGLSKIASDQLVIRSNGVQAGSSSSDQGTGTYGNHLLYVGRRANSSLPFNGDIFQLVVRGALTSGATLTSAEQYVAQRTGVTL